MNDTSSLYAGIDLHKSFFYAAVMDGSGNVIEECKYKTEQETIHTFFEKREPMKVAVEPLSQWGFFAEIAGECGHEIHLAHPLKVKAIASAKIKTDKIDATILGHLLRSNLLPEAYLAPRDVRERKELLRTRCFLVMIRTMLKNRIHTILHKNGVKLPKVSSLFNLKGRAWLEEPELPDIFAKERDALLAVLDIATAEMKKLDRIIKEAAKLDEDAVRLMTIPGISSLSALMILAEIGDVGRFPAPGKLCSYAGLIPSTYSSGGKTVHGHIVKQGSRYLRYILIEAAQRQARFRSRFGRYYLKKRIKTGGSKAKVATAKQMLTVIWHMLKEKTSYDDSHKYEEKGAGRLPLVTAR